MIRIVAQPGTRPFSDCYTQSMPDVDLTAHARTVIAERSIKEEWLERVFLNPEQVEPDRDDPAL